MVDLLKKILKVKYPEVMSLTKFNKNVELCKSRKNIYWEIETTQYTLISSEENKYLYMYNLYYIDYGKRILARHLSTKPRKVIDKEIAISILDNYLIIYSILQKKYWIYHYDNEYQLTLANKYIGDINDLMPERMKMYICLMNLS